MWYNKVMTIDKDKLRIQQQIIEGIQTVYDPEIHVNIWELGLIYDIIIKDDFSVTILMTLTSPACPVAGEMPGMVQRSIAHITEITSCDVELVWEPPWDKSMMSEIARVALDMY